MLHKSDRRQRQHTKPDHRPMLPEMRVPDAPLDIAIRQARSRHDDVNPDRNQKWR